LITFIVILLLANIMTIAYMISIMLYNAKGLRFLTYANDVLLENDDTEESEILTTKDIPILQESFQASKGMFYFSTLTLLVDLTILLFAIVPELQATPAWLFISWLATLTNSFIIIIFPSFTKIKLETNVTCESYNMLIQAYEHIEEYEEDNNDSVGKF